MFLKVVWGPRESEPPETESLGIENEESEYLISTLSESEAHWGLEIRV